MEMSEEGRGWRWVRRGGVEMGEEGRGGGI